MIAVLFLLCAAIGFFVLQTTVVNWFKKQDKNDLAGFVTQFTNLVEKASAELQAREQSGEPEPAGAKEE